MRYEVCVAPSWIKVISVIGSAAETLGTSHIEYTRWTERRQLLLRVAARSSSSVVAKPYTRLLRADEWVAAAVARNGDAGFAGSFDPADARRGLGAVPSPSGRSAGDASALRDGLLEGGSQALQIDLVEPHLAARAAVRLGEIKHLPERPRLPGPRLAVSTPVHIVHRATKAVRVRPAWGVGTDAAAPRFALWPRSGRR